MRRLSKLWSLSWHERKVICYACLLINSLRLALWLFSFNTVRHQLAQITSVWTCEHESVSLRFIIWAVTLSSHYTPGGAKCLVKALTAQLLLNRYGYDHQLHIGVAKSDSNDLEAHAWIEYQNQVIIGWLKDLNRFKPLSAIGVKR